MTHMESLSFDLKPGVECSEYGGNLLLNFNKSLVSCGKRCPSTSFISLLAGSHRRGGSPLFADGKNAWTHFVLLAKKKPNSPITKGRFQVKMEICSGRGSTSIFPV